MTTMWNTAKLIIVPVLIVVISSKIITCMYHDSNDINHEIDAVPECRQGGLRSILHVREDHVDDEQPMPEYLLISSIDGTITAIDAETGEKRWSTSQGPLLHSTIDKQPFFEGGKPVRYFPALNGNLYKITGSKVKPIPLTAEGLLKNSYRLTEDLVISGGTEMRTYALDLATGEVRYECGFQGCEKGTVFVDHPNGSHIILVRRKTEVVHAIEIKTGIVSWNFSVAQLDLDIFRELTSDKPAKNQNLADLKIPSLKVNVADGFISALEPAAEPSSIKDPLWSHKVESPIVKIWFMKGSYLVPIDMFDSELLGFREFDPSKALKPLLFIGSYDGTPYVQQSNQLTVMIESTLRNPKGRRRLPQIEWKPVAVHLDNEQKVSLTPNDPTTPASFFDDQENFGAYLMANNESKQDQCFGNLSDDFWKIHEYDEFESVTAPDTVVVSLIYWWKEVAVISIISAVVLNYVYAVLKRKWAKAKLCITIPKESGTEEKPGTNTSPTLVPSTPSSKTVQGHRRTPSWSASIQFPQIYDQSNYKSRYLTDFEPIQRLGKGGFGVVFEAKNRIDDHHYAIKRILLPFKEDAREKVMREVRALAKLDHHGIVRYYQAWLEVPPEGWQEMQDKEWDDSEIVSQSDQDLGHISAKPRDPFASSFTEKRKDASTLDSHDSFIVFDDNASKIKAVSSENDLIQKPPPDVKATEEETSEDQPSTKPKALARPKSLSTPRVYLYIQMQLCHKDTLKDWLMNNRDNRDKNYMLNIFFQITSAVEYVHGMGLMHRDLKPSNIFFSLNGNVKIGDFGLVTESVENGARTPSESDLGGDILLTSLKHTNQVGTHLYMSPEQMRGDIYCHKVDIFSMGLIFVELLIPFQTDMERTTVLTQARRRILPDSFMEEHPKECKLVKRLLSKNPEKRPSATEIAQHEIFSDFRDSNEGRKRTISTSDTH